MSGIEHTGQVRGMDILTLLNFPLCRLGTSFQDYINANLYIGERCLQWAQLLKKKAELNCLAAFIAFLTALTNISGKQLKEYTS